MTAARFAPAYLAELRSAVEAVAKAKHLTGTRVEHRVNARGELVVALLMPLASASHQQDDVRTWLESVAQKTGDGIRVASKKSAIAGDVMALIVPAMTPDEWRTLDAPALPTSPPRELLRAHMCLACHVVVEVPEYLALLALGWVAESPMLDASRSGWHCGRCATKPASRKKRHR